MMLLCYVASPYSPFPLKKQSLSVEITFWSLYAAIRWRPGLLYNIPQGGSWETKMKKCNKFGKMLLLSLDDGHMEVPYTVPSTLSENFYN